MPGGAHDIIAACRAVREASCIWLAMTRTLLTLHLYIACALAVGPGVAVLAADTTPAGSRGHDIEHHGGEASRCEQCHTASVFAPELKSRGCLACHTDGIPASSLPVAEGVAAGGGGADDAMGLQGPQYYEGSRFGADPGPMIRIPAGEFIMGTDERFSDEGPQHVVYLGDYLIDRYPVTNLQYQQFIEATHRRAPAHFEGRGHPPGKADHPVVQVSWFDARDYCAWAGKRLPTETEWEKAARGTDGRPFPWGEYFDIVRANTPVRWSALERRGDTTPVGAFPQGASPYGLHDVTGNVWEWTASWYKPYPGNDRPSENYGEIYRVLKGGSWWDCSFYKCGISAPVYNRGFFSARVRNDTFGFRCASDAQD
jgi:formylglycine-generating enzyme required for sulfatase activity